MYSNDFVIGPCVVSIPVGVHTDISPASYP